MTLEELVYSFCDPVYIIATQVSTNLYTKALKIDVWASEYDFENCWHKRTDDLKSYVHEPRSTSLISFITVESYFLFSGRLGRISSRI